MNLQFRAVLLSSVFSMHYCKQTEELLTGGMGIITFWAFWPSLDVPLGITQTLDWTCSSLQRNIAISSLLTDQHSPVLYALCGYCIKSFNLRSKKELPAFRGHGRATLLRLVPDWVQRYLYTGDASGHVQVWNQDTRSLLQEFRAHTRPVVGLTLQQDTRSLLTSSKDGWVKEWNCCGELLLKLFVDEPGGVCNLQSIGKRRVLCRSFSAFSVWKLQDVYQPFHEGGCSGRYLRRVECGQGRARLLSVSEDAIARLISPVSGQTLLLSWPYPQLEHALAFAYNPQQEELFVANGSPEVLVLDMTLCPCPAKRILCTSKIWDQGESVTALEAVMMGGADCADTKPPLCLVFSGHRSGTLQLLSPHGFNCQVQKAHRGAVLHISSLPGQKPQLCCHGADDQFTVWEVEVGGEEVNLALVSRINCCSSITRTCLLPGLIFALSPSNSLLLYSLLDKKCLTVDRNPPTAISCMDYCTALGLVALSGPAGIVEVWNTCGTLLAEIQLGASVSQVCFANARGDLLASFSGTISVIMGVRYLPGHLLRQVLDQAPADDLLEAPIPFLPLSPSCYDLGLVPRMLPKPAEETAQPEMPPTTSTVEHIQVTDVCMHKGSADRSTPPKRGRHGFYTSSVLKAETEGDITTRRGPEPGSVDQNQCKTLGQEADVEFVAQGWPVAADEFVPNSVIRNRDQKCEPQDTEDSSEVEALQDMYKPLHKSKHLHKYVDARVSRPVTLLKLSGDLDYFSEPGLEEEKVFDNHKNLLKTIAQSHWLTKKPKVIEVDSVMHALMLTMDCMDAGVYNNCTEALCSICKIHNLQSTMRQTLKRALLKNIQKENPHWKRLGALDTLRQLDLLCEGDMFLIAETLIDQAQDLRHVARDIIGQAYSIKHKGALLSHLRNAKNTPTRQVQQKLLQHLEDQLSEDLQLQQGAVPSQSPKSTQRLTKPYSPRTFTVDKEMTWVSNLPLLKSHGPTQLELHSDKVKCVSSFTKHPKPPHHTKKKHETLLTSFPDLVQSVPEKEREGSIDPAKLALCKKLKTCLPHPPTPHVLVSEDSALSSGSRRSASLVESPPGTRPGRSCLKASTCQGDPNWRESLGQLTSLCGFRSQTASKLADQGHLSGLPPVPPSKSCTLSPVQPSQLSLGQRVVEKVQMKEFSPLKFRHIVPLPWQLNTHTLHDTGASQYGRLQADWRAGCTDKPE
ncbi:hypothetical protein P4O66_018545, partial [Electrophorus voltai]